MPMPNSKLSPIETFSETIDVSRETLDRLGIYVDLLQKWQKRINLVGAETLDDVWHRHILDSAQLFSHIKDTKGRLLDLGSGAGFPGLVLSIMGAAEIALLESNQKKCSFLGEVIRRTACNAEVFHGRIEDYPDSKSADIITARALAPLDDLLNLSVPLLADHGICLFLKGETYEQELTECQKRWNMNVQIHPSLTAHNNSADEASPGVLIEIRNLSRRDG